MRVHVLVECSDAELNKVASRLSDWARDVHESSKTLKLSKPEMSKS